MERLIRSGLMFGNLVHVASPALVERYNRALKHLTGKTTSLTDFYVDISGFSPEVGHELGDDLYLNHAGVNRQFILLTTEQKRAPLLNAQFSTSRGILKQFIEENEPALFALTARDAVAGELVNSVYDMSSPARLFDIRRITIEADTTNGALRQAEKLDEKVERFMSEEDAWFDDVLIAEMIELAGQTGDVLRNPIDLKEMSFEQRNYWTDHFGGVYLFQDLELPGVICVSDKTPFESERIEYVFGIDERNRIASFLDLNGLVEPIVKARGIDASAILRQKMDFMLVDALADEGVEFAGRSRAEMRRLARRHSDLLPEEFHTLNALLNWAENGGPWPVISSDNPAYFYTLRAAANKDADLVNMLLAELAPKDVRQLFICHKSLFYRRYETWADTKRAYVVDLLLNEYQVDKMGTRAALFGHEAPMEEPAPPRPPEPEPEFEAVVRRVGPWGPVTRRAGKGTPYSADRKTRR
ncbi:hypothetical protein FIU89_06485 [Roseovarius sp. THAF27]|uniref:DUF6638 family protein n=1 Tax=Roseovarius sp. THAF27 TaxID=2587850 RepID=UPI00126790B5|nr:DUF6638 family protein [Roseovarius sp. THAF27]QFT80255.1 hypothetical protein FIU89_06485 [Roseovarius sp. THAF27]